ncbi:MAG: class I SAM-dependent methyltransferase [Erysipelotrichaceae bacterium]
MSHYFVNDPNLKSQKKCISYHFFDVEVRFQTDSGVFSKGEVDTGSLALLKVLVKQDLGKRILDLGCGYGVIGIILKKYFPTSEIEMVDVNERAIALSHENCRLNQTNNQITLSDGFANIKSTYDSIVTNPPIRAGKAVIYKMFEDSVDHLEEGGSLYVVMRKSHGALSAVKKLELLYGNCRVIGKDSGFYILRSIK